jgi:hypothetical protein
LRLQLRFSQDIRLLRNRCSPHELALGMLSEVMGLASQGNTSPSFATMFNLASIGTFLLSHSARLPQDGTRGKSDSNLVAESYVQSVLPGAVSRLETQRQALLLARFNTMLVIFNGCAAWRAQRNKPDEAAAEKPPGQQALEACYGPIALALERLAAPGCWPAAGAGGQDVREAPDVAILTYNLSMLCLALRVRWFARYIDLPRAARALRKLGYFRLAWLCVDCQSALERADALPSEDV